MLKLIDSGHKMNALINDNFPKTPELLHKFTIKNQTSRYKTLATKYLIPPKNLCLSRNLSRPIIDLYYPVPILQS